MTTKSVCTLLLTLFSTVPFARAQQSFQLTSTADRSVSLSATIRPTTATAASTHLLTLNTGDLRQSIDGFGYAITYSTCYNLLHMKPAAREAFLRQTFSDANGYGASYVRMSIGCNDFSSTEYTLCDKQGIANFALQSDETDYVIPILKEILRINPQVKVIAAPWTCPKWMKVDDLTSMKPHDSWTDGHLNPNYRKTYAQYFVRFVKAMQQEGISIYAVSPQNEPLNHGNCASTYMPWEEEAPLVKCMASAFQEAGLKTKIYVFDHNYNYDNVNSQTDYPIHVYSTLGESFAGSELVVGAAYHNYGGSETELDDIRKQAPEKELIFSETSIGTWNDGRNLQKRLLDDMEHVVLGTVNRYCRAVMVWNLMLDDHRGPNLDGGCQTCDGAVNIHQADYQILDYNSHYYIISHIASVVKPGAHRITTSGYTGKNLSHAAFLNPDGTTAVVFCSTSDAQQTLSVTDGKQYVEVLIPARSVVSVRMGNFQAPEITAYNGHTDYDGIQAVTANEAAGPAPIYNLRGEQMGYTMSSLPRGIYLSQGQKMIVHYE